MDSSVIILAVLLVMVVVILLLIFQARLTEPTSTHPVEHSVPESHHTTVESPAPVVEPEVAADAPESHDATEAPVAVAEPVVVADTIQTNVIIDTPAPEVEPVAVADVAERPITETPSPADMPAIAVDDLELIEGIGPKIATILNAAGIKNFAQLADMPSAEIKKILEDANLRLGDPTTWPDQARLAASGKFDELQQYQSQLKGGRKV